MPFQHHLSTSLARVLCFVTIATLSGQIASQSTYAGEPQEPLEQAAPPETGIWYDDTGRGAVEISRCGDFLCGHLVWLEKPLSAAGKPIHDNYNPDPEKQTRPVCGIQILGNLAHQPDGSFDKGWVYDPKNGKTFSVQINLANNDRLDVLGYAGIKMFSQSFVWTRAPADLKRCDH